jgi:Skp family chaperone for outer membrane proteins
MRKTLVATCAVLIGAAAIAGSTAWATVRLAAQPSAVASVDIIKLLDKLTERSDLDIELGQQGARAQAEIKARRDRLEQRAKEAEAIVDSAERRRAQDSLALEQLELREWMIIKDSELDRDAATRWRSLYRNIVAESEKFAQSEGYQYVIVYDGPAKIDANPRAQQSMAQQVVDQIMRRRILFADKADDITDKLILRMNNARAAGVTSSPAAPVAPGTSSSAGSSR